MSGFILFRPPSLNLLRFKNGLGHQINCFRENPSLRITQDKDRKHAFCRRESDVLLELH